MEISQKDLKLLFLSFDADENRQIDFAEFLHRLRPSLSPVRIKIIDEVFNKLDVNGDGAINTDDLKGKSSFHGNKNRFKTNMIDLLFE
jgi:Ca2+-binding EF-hand superfamily protein